LKPRNDLGAPLGKARNDLAFRFKRRLVGFGRSNVDISASHKAVTAGRASGLKSERRNRYNVGAVQRAQSMRRPNELDRSAAGPLVAHDFGDRQIGYCLFEYLLQTKLEIPSLGQGAEPDIFVPAIQRNVQMIGAIPSIGIAVSQVSAPDLVEALAQALSSLARRVRSGRCWHQLLDDFRVRRNRRYMADRHREPSRRSVWGRLAVRA